MTRSGSTTNYTYDNAQNRTHLTTVMIGGNRPPVAYADTLTVTAGASASINPLSNDTDPDSDPIILTGVSGWNSAKGSVSFVQNCAQSATSCVTYTAVGGQGSGSDSFSYTISDGKGGTATGTVNVTINAASAAPAVSNFTTSVAGNTSNNALPLAITGTATSVAVYSNPANASATPSGTNIYFSPTNGWSGQTSLQYTASNAAGTSAPATATVNVRPRVGNVTATVTERVQTVIPLSPQTNYTSLALIGYPKGDAYISGSNLYYNAYAGTGNSGDYFVYQATSAGGTSDSGQIYITINPPAPVNHNPVATVFNVNIAANSYAYFNGLANASDPDGDPLTLLSVTPPLHGSAWTNSNNYISYVPAADWSGTDGFYYTVSDGRGGTAQAAVNVYVSAPPPNSAPTANPGTTDPVWQSTTVYVDPTTNDTDPDGDALTVQSIDNFYCAYGQINGASACPSNIGSVSRSGNTLVYSAPFLSNSGSPGSNYAAIVVWYTINDGHGHTAQSYQTFNVYGPQ